MTTEIREVVCEAEKFRLILRIPIHTAEMRCTAIDAVVATPLHRCLLTAGVAGFLQCASCELTQLKWVDFGALGCEFAALAELFSQAAELPLKVGIGGTVCEPRLGVTTLLRQTVLAHRAEH